MPTPEARLATMLDHATAADPCGVLLYFHTPAEAEAFLADYTRFAAQRGADMPNRRRPDDLPIVLSDASGCAESPPQTGGGPAPDNELLHMTEHNVAVAAAAYCRSRNSLGRHDSELLHILEDTLAERDRVAQQPIEPQMGGGDAGEGARAVVEKWFGRPGGYDHPMLPDVAAALRDSHREGAEAMREACAQMIEAGWVERAPGMTAYDGPGIRELPPAIRALPIPGSKTDAG